MKRSNHAYLGGSVIVAIMALAVFAEGANACHHNDETVDRTSTELPQKDEEKSEIEA